MSFSRYIEWFKRDDEDEFRVDKEDISGVPQEALNQIIQKVSDDDDPNLYGFYELEAELVKLISKYLKHQIDLDKYECFIITRQP